MKYYFSMLILVAVVIASAGCSDDEPCIGAGGDVYAQECQTCHGVDAQGSGAAWLMGEGLKGFWTEVARGGIDPDMPAFGTDMLSDDELKAVLNFVIDGVDAQGATTYAATCSSCHGATPDKGGAGPGLAGDGLKTNWIPKVRSGQGDGSMPPFDGFICDDDINAVVDWLVDRTGVTGDAG